MTELEFKKNVYEYIKNNSMINHKDAVVIGVSGGADSVCLFRVLLELLEEFKKAGKTFDIKAVHVNHMIRDTATRDEEFVRALCEKHKVAVEVVKKDVISYAKEKHLSTEEAGRIIRYESFYDCARTMNVEGETVIAVAHNLNDNSETIMFNMFRGSGVKGVSGIAPVAYNMQDMKIVRPLLGQTRECIEEYLEAIGQNYVTDETNLTNDYTRNVIRNEIFPMVCDRINGKAVENVAAAGGVVSKAYDYIQKVVDKEYERLVSLQKNKVYIDRARFLELEEIIQDEIIKKAMVEVCGQAKDLTQVHIKNTREIFKGDKNRIINLPYSMVGENVYGRISLRKEEKTMDTAKCVDEEVEICREELDKNKEYEACFGEERYHFRLIDLESGEESDKTYIKNIINEKNNYTKCFDYGKILGSLVLRNRRDGDYLTISKEGNRKKLKSIFIDSKIEPKERRTYTLLTCEAEVIWIVSMRTGCSAYVDENTKKVLVVSRN